MSCAHKFHVVSPTDVAVACDVSPAEELILIFIANGHVRAQRIFLVYAIDTGRIMNLGPADLSGIS